MSKKADEVIPQAEEEKEQKASDAGDTFPIFRDSQGEMFTMQEAMEVVAENKDWDEQRAYDAIRGLVNDTLDPVQHVMADGERHVGIIDYREFNEEGGYGYVEYDDTLGRRKTVVCSLCVKDSEYDHEPFRCVEGYGRHDEGCSFDDLLDHLEEHYENEHDKKAETVEVGASLVSGTTVASNSVFHNGNLSPLETTGGTMTGTLTISGALQLPNSFN